jgi:hypothetical protein
VEWWVLKVTFRYTSGIGFETILKVRGEQEWPGVDSH